MWGAYFWMGTYKCDVVVVIKWVLIFMVYIFSIGTYYHFLTFWREKPVYGLQPVSSLPSKSIEEFDGGLGWDAPAC